MKETVGFNSILFDTYRQFVVMVAGYDCLLIIRKGAASWLLIRWIRKDSSRFSGKTGY